MQGKQQLRGNLRDGLHRGQHRRLHDPPRSHAGRAAPGPCPRHRRRPDLHGLPRFALRHGQALPSGQRRRGRARDLLDLRGVVVGGVGVPLPGAAGNEGSYAGADRGLLQREERVVGYEGQE